MKQDDSFNTHDLNVAGFLLAKGFPLVRIESAGGFRKTFCFPLDAREVADQFYSDAPVPARSFANAIRDLKARVMMA